MSSGLPFALYNPALLTPDALLGEFIARRPMLDALLNTIRENTAGHAPQHVLLVGARGMGKTTTLWAIAHSVSRDATLAREWQPVVFDEESRRVGDLADFWLEAIRQWEHATKDPGNRTQALLDTAGADIEDRAREVFLSAVKTSGRRALLLIDNLNDVLASIRDPEPLHRLRAFLMEDSRVMLIGGATRYFPEVTDVDQPFYDFFRAFELKPLSLEEMKACLLALAQSRGGETVEKAVREREGTMRSLHLLTGGNPRLIKTFYRLLAEGLRGDIRADLERLLDEFTPYFKSIVDALPTQQQRIFDTVALNWDPVDVATIAHATRVPSNQVSSQLRMLVKAGHVAEAAGSPKRKTYLLADRFSNIHYLMRHGRAAGSRFNWFVAILRLIFPDQDHATTLARLARQTAECGPEGMRDARELLHSALSRADSADSRRELLHATFRETWDKDTFNSFSHWFDLTEAKPHLPESDILAFFQQMPTALRKKLGYEPSSAQWWHRLTDFLEEKSAWALAEAAYRKAIELDPKRAYPWNDLGNLLQNHLGRPAEAEVAYRKAIELGPIYAYPWNGLGNLLKNHLSRPAEAEAAYRKAIELDPIYANPWNGLGNLLQDHLGRPAEAEVAYRKAIELDPELAYPWNGLGNLLQVHFSRPAEAEVAYRKAIELDPKFTNPWNGLGSLLRVYLGRPAEAEAAYRKAIELDPKLARPLSGLAELLSKQDGRISEARDCAIQALLLEPDSVFVRHAFQQLCTDQAKAWQAVLPSLAAWCASHPKAGNVFEFTVDGFIRFARLTSPAEALALLDSAPAAAQPFETLRDAFLAHADRNHLDRLAPERKVVAIELLNRIKNPPADQSQS
ncbi:MAG: tetratricopeptide repeat protein [Candidatus Didemnitutus sp.]|nr:tetratricopeptide repeat protein [Candidatus Didemnitutus sp.]